MGGSGQNGRTGKEGKTKWLILFLACLVFLLYGTVYLNRIVKPNLIALGEIRARAVATEQIADAVESVLSEDGALEDLLEFERSESGAITMVRASFAGTVKGAELSRAIRQNFSDLSVQSIEVPLGAVLGSSFLSQFDSNVSLRVIPLGATKVTLKSDFKGAGINQTKYKIYLDVTGRLRLLAPFSKKEINIKNQYLLAEVVIVGDVPESYVVVPYDEILDALNM